MEFKGAGRVGGVLQVVGSNPPRQCGFRSLLRGVLPRSGFPQRIETLKGVLSAVSAKIYLCTPRGPGAATFAW